jgi:sugar phosphate isomerase/epimerase
MNRRDFMSRSAGIAGCMAGSFLTPAALWGQGVSKRARIGVSTWSFHNFFAKTRDDNAPSPATTIEMLDFPELIADRFQVHELEFVAPHFTSTDATYLRDLKSRLARAHSHLVNIPVDIDELELGAGLSDPDPKIHDLVIEACSKWIDIAHELGAGSIRCDPGKINPENLAPTVASYRRLSDYGASKGIAVIVENHGGVGSEHPEELVRIFQQVGSKWFGALPDFGNFPNNVTRERGIPMLLPYALTVCHTKASRLPEYGMDDEKFVAHCVELAKQANFRGVFSIEYSRPDSYEGVQRVVDLLMKYL